ncbi:hypothetical protein HYU15_02185, partial [Candidatus Woesearchaeota archaeon]|nr:hypothetical protein [Candidatus Woesearchaeota archaeon]
QPEANYPIYYSTAVPNQSVCIAKFFAANRSCIQLQACTAGCCCPEASIKSSALCNTTFYQIQPGQSCSATCKSTIPPITTGCMPSLNLTAANVKGEKQIHLNWKDNCDSDKFTIERCKGSGCNNFSKLADYYDTSYTDSDSALLWNQHYTYRVTATINNTPYTETAAIYTGDLECWKKASSSFCMHEFIYEEQPIMTYLVTALNFSPNLDSFRQQVINAYSGKFNTASYCDDSNKLSKTSSCAAGTICTITNYGSDCVKSTKCSELGKPFGLFSSRESCETENYCFYDKSQGNINQCYDCSPKMSCYDYKSEDACEKNNCGAGDCFWRTTNEELGTGVCVDYNKNNCVWCDKKGTPGTGSLKGYNTIFDRCTQEKKDALSTYLYDCNRIITECKETCQSFNAENCSSHSPLYVDWDNYVIPREFNACSLYTCKWFGPVFSQGGKCRKDADFDSKEDCTTASCEKDYFAPETTIKQSGDKLIINALERKSYDDYGSYTANTTAYLCSFTDFLDESGNEYSSDYLKCLDTKNYNSTRQQLHSIRELVKLGVLKQGTQHLYYFSRDENKNLEVVKEAIVIPELEITLIEPRFGAARSAIYNLTLSTNRNATCRIGFIDLPYVLMSIRATPEQRGTMHVKTAVAGSGTLYAKCRDSDGNIRAAQFKISILTTPPTITSIRAADIIELPMRTEMTAEADQEVVCRYTKNSTASYRQMQSFAAGDENTESSYKKIHRQNLTEKELVDRQTNTFYVQCMNKAGLLSEKTASNVVVNTNQDPVLSLNYRQYTSNTTFDIEAATNKLAQCVHSNTSDYRNAQVFGTVSKRHKARLFLLNESRTYTYYVQCAYEDGATRQQTATFTIDTTPPAKPRVTASAEGSNITQYLHKLEGSWKASDNESGIKQYQYSVYDASNDRLILNWTSTADDKETITGLSLREKGSYYIQAKAQNNAELWSESGKSETVTVVIGGAGHCYNRQKDQGEADVDCGAECDKCSPGKDCAANSDCSSGKCASGKCEQAGCSDGARNQNETDVDCGGSCDKCSTGQSCASNTDCYSASCISGKCSSSTEPCSNGVLDPDEASTDCGGICARIKDKKCETGKSCTANSDCSSGKCTSGKCAGSNDKDGDGKTDSEDNCPDKYNPDQADSDQDKKGDACDTDLDNDGMDDDWEKRHGLNAEGDDGAEDPDGDKLTNLDEYNYFRDTGKEIDPQSKDTDGDGASDKKEIDAGTDPTDPEDKPKGSQLLKLLMWMLVLAAIAGIGYYALRKMMLKPPRQRQQMQGFEASRAPTAPRAPQPMQQPPQRMPIRPETAQAIIRKRESERASSRRELLSQFEIRRNAATPAASLKQERKPVREEKGIDGDDEIFRQLRQEAESLKAAAKHPLRHKRSQGRKKR